MPGSITSCSNSRVKSICALQRKRIRDTEDAFIFEGNKLFREALAWDVPITDIFYNTVTHSSRYWRRMD
ncbi:hypothetical protein [Eubacterium aggregans]|uniref:hypothetical protein n=1 Tax=Eubacterium aggregans TaxID=81409 RepID=UPI003F415F48